VTYHPSRLKKGERVFLIVFPRPPEPEDVGGEFRIIVNEGMIKKY
jgi:hypothetical protein